MSEWARCTLVAFKWLGPCPALAVLLTSILLGPAPGGILFLAQLTFWMTVVALILCAYAAALGVLMVWLEGKFDQWFGEKPYTPKQPASES